MASAQRTIVVEFAAGPLDGWVSEQTHDRPVTLPEALHAESGFYVLEMYLDSAWSGSQRRVYRYQWREGAL